MSILGDIIEVHHRRFHPRLGMVDDTHAVAIIGELLANCEASIDKLRQEIEIVEYAAPMPTPGAAGPSIKDLISGYTNVPPQPPLPPPPTTTTTTAAATRAKDRSRLQLVTAYSTHILHVLHVLLHGKWDAISMLDDDDDWITSARFNSCASHAIAASQAVSQILKFDPELTFMPYLFGIYLLHGSFILLLFADRMPRVGPNQSVELACETIVRAHEVCVVTLSTEFQVSLAGQCHIWVDMSMLTPIARKTSARFCDRHCTACEARVPRSGRSTRPGGGLSHCIAGRKGRRGWRFDICAGSCIYTRSTYHMWCRCKGLVLKSRT